MDSAMLQKVTKLHYRMESRTGLIFKHRDLLKNGLAWEYNRDMHVYLANINLSTNRARGLQIMALEFRGILSASKRLKQYEIIRTVNTLSQYLTVRTPGITLLSLLQIQI